MSLLISVLLSVMTLCLGHTSVPGKFIDHDRTVVNCAKYKREANQHSCVLSPFNTEGPYFVEDDYERSDITDGRSGIPFDLRINLVNANDCTPLENMYIHIWHCDAVGIYSGVANAGQDGVPVGIPAGQPGSMKPVGNGGPGDPGMGPNGGRLPITSDERFFRGYQITDSEGQVAFKTIIPGWYTGRCLHIHVEIYSKKSTERKDVLFVGQLYFNRELPYQLKLISPYSTNNQPLTLNDGDKIYPHFGNETTLELMPNGKNKFSSSITLGIDPDALKNVV